MAPELHLQSANILRRAFCRQKACCFEWAGRWRQHALLGLLTLVCVAPAAAEPPPHATEGVGGSQFAAAPAADWDAAFTRLDDWTGGDVVGSVDLEDGRVLWLFGDTWIGRVTEGKHVDAHLVNNTIAVEDRLGLSDGQAPGPKRLRFYWGQKTPRRPTAWIAPDGAKTPDDATPSDWYWFTGGGALAMAPDGAPQAVAFLFHIARQANQPGIWGFESCGSVLATIDHLTETVDRWIVTQHRIPFAIDAAAHRADPALEETAWGMAAWREPPREPGEPGQLYIYGTRGGPPAKLLLARAPANAIADFSAWRFYAGAGGWSERPSDAAPIVDGIPSEFSVEAAVLSGRRRFLMIHSETYLGRRIYLRSAELPEGPWTAPIEVYAAPEPQGNAKYFAYAAKGHLALSPPGELLISYVVNSHDFNLMVQDASIYRPRFLLAPLSMAPPALGSSRKQSQ